MLLLKAFKILGSFTRKKVRNSYFALSKIACLNIRYVSYDQMDLEPELLGQV
jgi:hypothetical protein